MIDKILVDFRREIETKKPGGQQYLGLPPVLDYRSCCTFCGNHAGFHKLPDTFAYDVSRQLREFHRNDFGPGGVYEDEWC